MIEAITQALKQLTDQGYEPSISFRLPFDGGNGINIRLTVRPKDGGLSMHREDYIPAMELAHRHRYVIIPQVIQNMVADVERALDERKEKNIASTILDVVEVTNRVAIETGVSFSLGVGGEEFIIGASVTPPGEQWPRSNTMVVNPRDLDLIKLEDDLREMVLSLLDDEAPKEARP